MKLDIKIKQGLGDILFDTAIEDIVAALGEAQEVETIDNVDDMPTTIMRYGDDVSLFFEGDNPTLTCIDIANEDCTLFGKEVFDMNEKEIVALMVSNNYFEQDADTEDWGERRISFPEGNIDFFFEDDELMSIIIGK
ncbi:MAG: hypothetical protein KBT45_06850 [Bacteroidales bacterium]|nr:hypothetical protein [Candidatus Colimorpha pelethequi]